MPDPTFQLPFEEDLVRLIHHCVNATGPFPKDAYASRTIVDFLRKKWSEEISDHHYAWTKIIEHPVIASSSFLGDGSVLDLVLARLDELAEVERELRDLKKKPSEFVPHFKLHRDGSITPQQDDTVLWTTVPNPEPLALAVTESAVEEVEVTQEAASWRAGGTGVPTFWNLDKLREMRDGALTEWIEVEAIIREVEKREKEEAPIRKMIAEIQDVLYPDRNDISADEARRVQVLARYLVKKEQS